MMKNMAEKEIILAFLLTPSTLYVHLIKYFQTVQDFVADFFALDTPPCYSNIQMVQDNFLYL